MIRAENSNLPEECVLPLIVLKKYTRRAMQLRNDDTFSTIDDERAGRRHERQLAHIHFLLFHFLDDRLGWRFLIENHQSHFGTQRRCIGQAALLTFFYIERWIAQNIRQKFQASKSIMRHNRKNGRKGRLQALIFALEVFFPFVKSLNRTRAESQVRTELGERWRVSRMICEYAFSQ